VEVHRDQGRQRKNDTHLLLKQLAFVFFVESYKSVLYVEKKMKNAVPQEYPYVFSPDALTQIERKKERQY
jgi:hypothetical protein